MVAAMRLELVAAFVRIRTPNTLEPEKSDIGFRAPCLPARRCPRRQS
jgi:hypothetical protein